MNGSNADLRTLGVRALVTADWTAAFVSVVGSLLVWGSRGFEAQALSFAHGIAGGLAIATASLVYATVGAVLAARLPRNAIGWLLLAFGIFVGFLPPVTLMVGQTVEVFRAVPETTLALAWLYSSFLTPVCWAIAVLIGLIFPNGRLLSRRWWLGAVLGVSGAAMVAAVAAVSPQGLVWYPSLSNPLSMAVSAEPVLCVIKLVGLGLMVAGLGVAVISSAIRYRHGDADTRHQLHWFVLAGLVLAVTATPFGAARYAFQTSESVGEALLVLVLAGASLTPLAVAAAIMRYQLFGLEVFIGRTLVYIPLTGILGGLYAASVALFQRVFVGLTGNTSDAAIVISTLILAAVFTPVRKSLEGHVDRHFKAQPGHSAEVAVAAGAGAADASPVAGQPAVGAATSFAGREGTILERLGELEAELQVLRGARPAGSEVGGVKLGRLRHSRIRRSLPAAAAS